MSNPDTDNCPKCGSFHGEGDASLCFHCTTPKRPVAREIVAFRKTKHPETYELLTDSGGTRLTGENIQLVERQALTALEARVDKLERALRRIVHRAMNGEEIGSQLVDAEALLAELGEERK